jgi:hypothetical protein
MEKYYKIITLDNDGDFFEISQKNAYECEILRNCIKRGNNARTFEIPITCSLQDAKNVCNFLNYTDEYWTSFNNEQIINCLEAASYLICEKAIKSIGNEIAKRIKGKSILEIKQILNLKDDNLSNEEIDQFETENYLIKKCKIN